MGGSGPSFFGGKIDIDGLDVDQKWSPILPVFAHFSHKSSMLDGFRK